MRNLNKWHLMGGIVLLYALVVVAAMFTHQPAATMSQLLESGSGGVGLLCVLILFFG